MPHACCLSCVPPVNTCNRREGTPYVVQVYEEEGNALVQVYEEEGNTLVQEYEEEGNTLRSAGV